MRTRIGASLMIAVSAFFMSGGLAAFMGPELTVEYMTASADGHLLPLVVD